MASRPKTIGRTLPDAAERLYRYAASIRAVEEGEVNQFTACLEALAKVAAALDAPLAIVGGLAAIHHGARVTTLDVDVAAGKGQLRRLLEEAPRHGFALKAASERGWHRFVFRHGSGDVDLHIVPEGENSPRDPPHAPPNPSPQDLGVTRGLAYAEFAPWVAMKIVAGREKDRYHLIEALKGSDQTKVAAAVVKLRGMHPSYLREFERLLRAAEEEKQDRW
ncbi:MAG: hypothetical protein HY721_07465 [Planctomycetes bacterium]|nr:hypothetical protein [Planctomycetota bacterium]